MSFVKKNIVERKKKDTKTLKTPGRFPEQWKKIFESDEASKESSDLFSKPVDKSLKLRGKIS